MKSDGSRGGAQSPDVLLDSLVERLKAGGSLTTPVVEAAFRQIPRHLFLPGVPFERVYNDEAIPTKLQDGIPISSSSQPAIMAIMLEQLDLRPGQRVLEIGAGTGYNAALMAQIVGESGHLTTVDIDQDIVDGARAQLAAAGLNHVSVVCADGGLGYPSGAPYDRIILTVGAWDIAPAWFEQLAPSGRLVLPLDLRGVQKSVAFERVDGSLQSVSVKDCGFMRLRGTFAGPESYYRIAAAPGLWLRCDRSEAADPEFVHRLLTGPWHDTDAHVSVALREVFGDLSLWLTLHEESYCILGAEGATAGTGLLPPLFHWSSASRSTLGLLESTSLCLLTIPQQLDHPLDLSDIQTRFELVVRSFGQDDALRRRLVDEIRAWSSAGRPSSQDLRIRVYRHETGYVAAPDEILLGKRWTQLVLSWR